MTGGLEAIISDEEIMRVHGRADFGPTMTPRDVVNEGVRKYAVGYTSGYTQLTILLEHGLITKPRPGRYEASLTKKGKRYARALGMYHDTPAERAEARVREAERKTELYDHIRAVAEANGFKSLTEAIARATAAEARADRLAKALEGAIDDLLTSLRFRGGGWECTEDELVGQYRAALQEAEGKA